MAYINPDIAQIDWDDLTGWTAIDGGGGVSEISPAGQLHLDMRAATGNAEAGRYKDIGTIGSGDYYVEVRFKGDTWDGYGAQGTWGLRPRVDGATKRLRFGISNGDPTGNGIWLDDGVSRPRVFTKTWDNNWHTIVLFVHNGQTDVDMWIDKDPATEAADVTDADCSDEIQFDGLVLAEGLGSPDGNGRYHFDYFYIGTELRGAVEYTLAVTVGAFTLTGIAALLIKGYTLVASVGNFTLTGVAAIFTKALNMAVTVGAFTLTGISVVLNRGLTMIASVGAFILTGIAAILTSDTLWENQEQSGDISSINLAKTNISPTNITKNDISSTNLTKIDISPTNVTKNSISPTNSTKS